MNNQLSTNLSQKQHGVLAGTDELQTHGQKILTALYLVTEHISKDDQLTKSLRKNAGRVLEIIHLHGAQGSSNKSVSLLEKSIHYLRSVQSFFQVLGKIGKISQANFSVLENQLEVFEKKIQRNIENSLKTSEQSMLKNSEANIQSIFSQETKENNLHRETRDDVSKENFRESDNEKDEGIKTQPVDFIQKKNDVSEEKKDIQKPTHQLIQKVVDSAPEKKMFAFTSGKTHEIKNQLLQSGTNNVEPEKKVLVFESKGSDAKDTRHKGILSVLQKKNDVSINDICDFFSDCSSKTIQRDLNELIDMGHVAKKGSRRWSTYSLSK